MSLVIKRAPKKSWAIGIVLGVLAYIMGLAIGVAISMMFVERLLQSSSTGEQFLVNLINVAIPLSILGHGLSLGTVVILGRKYAPITAILISWGFLFVLPNVAIWLMAMKP